MRCSNQPSPAPRATPPTAARANSPRPSAIVTPVPTVVVAIATASSTRKSVSAVASLSRLSPSRIVMSRRWRPRRRPIDAAATASGGATTAPSTSALASGSSGTSSHAAIPTTAVLNTTRPIASWLIRFMFSRRRSVELSSAAEYSSGGRTRKSTRSGSRGTTGMPGTNDIASPTTTSSSGAESA